MSLEEPIPLYNKTLHPPTAVKCCVKANFVTPHELNLIVSKGNTLEVYETTTNLSTNTVTSLRLRKRWELQGKIHDLGVARFAAFQTDCLLVAIAEAKLSVVCFNRETDDLHTISLHMLEDDKLQEERMKQTPLDLQVRVDPQYRCVALFVYHRFVYILPYDLQTTLSSGELDNPFEVGGKPATGTVVHSKIPLSRCVELDLYDLNLQSVRDVCFLHGYAEPALAILYGDMPEWVDQLDKPLQCCLIAVALTDVKKEIAKLEAPPEILKQPSLCSDSFRLISLPEPIGGVLVVSNHAVIHVTQNKCNACYANDYGKDELSAGHGHFPKPALKGRVTLKKTLKRSAAEEQDMSGLVDLFTGGPTPTPDLDAAIDIETSEEPLCFTFANSCSCLISTTDVLFALNDRSIYQLALSNHKSSSSGSSWYFQVGKIAAVPSDVVALAPSWLFVASRVCDSLLLRVTEKPLPKPEPQIPAHHTTTTTTSPVKVEPKSEAANFLSGLLSPGKPKEDFTKLNQDDLADWDAIYGADTLVTAPTPEEPTSAVTAEEQLEGMFAEVPSLRRGKPPSPELEVVECDYILNIGPIVHMDYGELVEEGGRAAPVLKKRARPGHLKTDHRLEHLELVACGGYHETGFLSVLQRGIKPELITAENVPNIEQLWTLKIPPLGDCLNDLDDDTQEQRFPTVTTSDCHTHLVISCLTPGTTDAVTIVLECGTSLEQMDNPLQLGIDPEARTLDVGLMCDNRLIVHIQQDRLILWSRVPSLTKMCTVPVLDDDQRKMMELNEATLPPTDIEGEAPKPDVQDELIIHASCITNTLIVLLLSDGTIRYHQLHPIDIYLEELKRTLSEIKKITPEELAERRRGFIGCKMLDTRTPNLTKGLGCITAFCVIEYTDIADSCIRMHGKEPKQLCWVWWTSGVLEAYTIPEWKSVWISRAAIHMGSVLSDFPFDPSRLRLPMYQQLYATDIVIQRIGDNQQAWLFLMMNNGELNIYTPFTYDNKTNAADRLGHLRFSKYTHSFVNRSTNFGSELLQKPAEGSPEWRQKLTAAGLKPGQHQTFVNTPHQKKLVPFDDINGYSGLFACGKLPLWIFSCKEYPVVHPMFLDGTVTHFAPLHMYSCSNGFVSYNSQGLLKIYQFDNTKPYTQALNESWPTTRIPLHATPHFVLWNAAMRTFTVVTSVANEFDPKTVQASDPTDMDGLQRLRLKVEHYEKKAVPRPCTDTYSIKLYSGDTFKLLDSIPCTHNEAVLAAKTLPISSENKTAHQTDDDELNLRLRRGNKLTNVQVFGSGVTTDNDHPCRGRILLAVVAPRVSKTKEDSQLLILYHELAKGPVTAVAAINGYLVMSITPKIMVYFYDWPTKKLIISAFYDSQFYITSMTSIKNYVIYGDAYKSISFLQWREDILKLVLLGKDFEKLHVTCVGFVYRGNKLALLAADKDGNCQVFSFAPTSPGSNDGTILFPIADIHIGSTISTMLQSVSNHNASVIYGTLDGAIGYCTPVSEVVSQRLAALHLRMIDHVPHPCGLNPKSFRLSTAEKLQTRELVGRFRSLYSSIIDGDLVSTYCGLDFSQQSSLASLNKTLPFLLISDIVSVSQFSTPQ